MELTNQDWKDIVDGLTLAIRNQKPTERFRNRLYDLRFYVEDELKKSSKHSLNNDFIQFLEDLNLPVITNSPNPIEFRNGAKVMKNIILKKLISLSRE